MHLTRGFLLVLSASVLLMCTKSNNVVNAAEPARAEEYCDYSICTNRSVAIARGHASAWDDYDACLARANGITAFICRCTPRVYECMTNGTLGGCNQQRARTECRRYVVDQGLGCSQRLCIAAAPTTALASATLLAVVAAVYALV
jgi:hypothetical protein